MFVSYMVVYQICAHQVAAHAHALTPHILLVSYNYRYYEHVNSTVHFTLVIKMCGSHFGRTT